VGGYTAAVDEAAAAHQRMGDTFSSFVDQMKAREEAMAKGGDMTAFDDMIIGADGLVNINAANKALYEQAKGGRGQRGRTCPVRRCDRPANRGTGKGRAKGRYPHGENQATGRQRG
jgi:hypothetical protein